MVEQNEHRSLTATMLEKFIENDVMGFERVLRDIEKILVLKHKYKYALSTNLPCVSRHSQFSALLCIFPELISLQESCCSRFRLSSRLFGGLKCLLLLIVHHFLEIINDHPSLVVKVAKSFCKNTEYCSAKSKFRCLLSVEFVINQSTINFKSGQSVLAIHDSPPFVEISKDDVMTYQTYNLTTTSNDFELR